MASMHVMSQSSAVGVNINAMLAVMIIMCAKWCGADASSLYDTLMQVEFRNQGVTTSSDGFHWETVQTVGDHQVPIYLEADNVSCSQCVWSDGGKYFIPHPYLFKDTPTPVGKQGQQGVYKGISPASGMRSAVPLGGVSAGSVELRGDGSLHEWIIHNAGPHGAAKVQSYLHSFFAASVNGNKKVLQTHPWVASPGLDSFGVSSMRYQGSHPVSRLDVVDPLDGVQLSLFGFSSFRANDRATSSRPAIAFTLAFNNTNAHNNNNNNNNNAQTNNTNAHNNNTNAQDAPVGFAFQLPLLIETEQARHGTPLQSGQPPQGSIVDAPACAKACMSNSACRSWTMVISSKTCTLQQDVPLNVYEQGTTSGIKGHWEVDETSQCLTLVRPGRGPMHGNVSICVSSTGFAKDAEWWHGTSDDPTAVVSAMNSSSSTAPSLSSTASMKTGAAATNYTILGNGDFNADPILRDGTQNIVASVEVCEAQCTALETCHVGLWLSGSDRHGECWLAGNKLAVPRTDFCGVNAAQQCVAFLKQLGPPPPPPSPTPPPPPGLAGAYGHVGGRATLAAGATATMTITLGWNLPNRDHYNYNPMSESSFVRFGNQYTQYYADSTTAAWGDVAPTERDNALVKVLEDIAAWHTPIMKSSLPTFLQDLMVNSLSHTRDSMWWKDCPGCHVSKDPRVNGTDGKGFWRQYEAYDCPDIDSIHNDGERHIPYIMLLANGTRSKLAAWAGNQGANGMLAEQILNNNPDSPQGRVMSDSTSMFIIYVLELLMWDGDHTTASLYYPTVKRAAQWQMSTCDKLGVPYKLETTYDILKFPSYDVSTYATVFHLAAMRAAELLATYAGDTAFANECRDAYASARSAFDTLQWNSNGGHYWAASNQCTNGTGCAQGVGSFADAFYAQVLMFSLLGEDLITTPARLDMHLNATYEQNCLHTDVRDGNGTYNLVPGCPNGLVIMTGRPVQQTDEQVWEMATYDHAALMIQRANVSQQAQIKKALALAEGTGTGYSQRINDQWNVAGIKSNDGYPAITSHYGYHMVHWHVALALSGQFVNLATKGRRVISFSPKLPCDYSLPILLPRLIGSVSCAGNVYTVTVHSGGLEVNILQVSGTVYPSNPVTLQVNKSYTWSSNSLV